MLTSFTSSVVVPEPIDLQRVCVRLPLAELVVGREQEVIRCSRALLKPMFE